MPEKLVTIILPEDKSKVTEFARKGMVYVMDAWVRKADVEMQEPDRPRTGFHRPART